MPDFRSTRGRRYPLATIVTIAVAAKLAGYRGATAIGEFSQGLTQHQLRTLRAFYSPRLKRFTAPSTTAFVKVLTRLDPDVLDRAARTWAAQQASRTDPVAIREVFPLSDPETRARSHRDNVEAERPLLVDPASEEPRQHIRFRGSASEPLTERGRETIRVLGLNRSDLEEDRRERLDILDVLRETVRLGERVGEAPVERARNLLEHAVRPVAKYSSMARYFLEPDNG